MGTSKELSKEKKEKHRQYSRKHARKVYSKVRARAKDAIDEFKNKPCADCGGSFPACAMDIIQRPKSKVKMSSMSTATPLYIQRTLKGAVVVCANCGRERAYQKVWRHYGMEK